MAIFLDDGLGGGVSIVKAKINTLIVHTDLSTVFKLTKTNLFGSLFKISPGSALYLILIEVFSQLLKVGFLN